MTLLDRITRRLTRAFALTAEDAQRRQLQHAIRVISNQHPTATEATSEWVLLRSIHRPRETLRDVLDRNAVRVGRYWVGIQSMVNTYDELIYLDLPGEEPLCVFSSGWIAEGPWQQELPNLLTVEMLLVQHLPDQDGRDRAARARAERRAADKFHTL